MAACLCRATASGSSGYYDRACVHTKKSHKHDHKNFEACSSSDVEKRIMHGTMDIEWQSMETVDRVDSKAKRSLDDADAYGEHQSKPKETKKITKSATLADFIAQYATTAK